MEAGFHRYTFCIDREDLEKMKYIAARNGRSVNQEVGQLFKKCVRAFERKNGPIPTVAPEER